jgi:hypothetical protein
MTDDDLTPQDADFVRRAQLLTSYMAYTAAKCGGNIMAVANTQPGHLILATRQAFIDVLVEARVLMDTRQSSIDHRRLYAIAQPVPTLDPSHVHDWTPKRADRSLTGAGVVHWQCDCCHEGRWTEAPKPDAQ